MGRRTKRLVYDPTIVSRLADDANYDDDDDDNENTFGETEASYSPGNSNSSLGYDRNHPLDDIDGYTNHHEDERQETQEILDPKMDYGLSRQRQVSRRRRCLLVSALVAVVLAAVITTSVVLTQKNKSSKKKRESRESVPLTAPPADLPGLCTEIVNFLGADVVTADDLAECQAACAPAACCDIPAQFDASCLRNNEDVCLQYHTQCYVLSMVKGAGLEAGLHAGSLNVTVPDAPTNLTDVCSTNNLVTNTGVHDCAALCLPYECCYESNVASCLDQPTCAQYGPCLNLKAHDNVAPTIKDEVDALCQPRQTMYGLDDSHRGECANACKLARCCATEPGCYLKDDAGFCNQYESCKVLWDEEKADATATDGGDDEYYDDDVGEGDDTYYGDDDYVADDGQEGNDQDDLVKTLPEAQWGDDNPQNWDDGAGDDGGDDAAGDDGGDDAAGDDGGDDAAGDDGGDDAAGGDGTDGTMD